MSVRPWYRRRLLRTWWQVDRLANRLVVWTGRRVARAYDRLVEVER